MARRLPDLHEPTPAHVRRRLAIYNTYYQDETQTMRRVAESIGLSVSVVSQHIRREEFLRRLRPPKPVDVDAAAAGHAKVAAGDLWAWVVGGALGVKERKKYALDVLSLFSGSAA